MRERLLRSDCFLVEIDGIAAAGFAACSGLRATTGVFEYREGGFVGTRLFRDGVRSGRLLLERGLVRDRELWHWFETAEPRDGAVVLLDSTGGEAMRWCLEAAWPSLWEGPELRADASEVAVERLGIVYERLQCRVT